MPSSIEAENRSGPEPSPADQRRRPRHWLFRLLTLGLVLVGQEPLFRWMFPFPDAVGFNRIHYSQMVPADPRRGAALERGLVYDRLLVESLPDGFAKVHSLNLYGFRGPDFAIEPAPGRRRILVFGDSVVEGEGADDSATITAEWSRLLAREGTAAEVVNLGVIAANLQRLAVLTRDAIPLLHPTDVVVALYANDLPAPEYQPGYDEPSRPFPNDLTPWWEPRLAALAERVVFEKPIHRRWPHPALRFFARVPDAANPWSDKRDRPAALAPALYDAMRAGRLNPWLYHQSADMPIALSHDFASGGAPDRFLRRMAQLCRENGARLVLAYVPFCGVVSPRYAPSLVELGMDRTIAEALSTDPRYRSQNRSLADLCGELALPLADATTDLERAEAAGTPQYWKYDTHPNPQGYATIARSIHAAWRKTVQRDTGEKRIDRISISRWP